MAKTRKLSKQVAKQFRIFYPKKSVLFRWGTKRDKQKAYKQTKKYVVNWPKSKPPPGL